MMDKNMLQKKKKNIAYEKEAMVKQFEQKEIHKT